VPKDLADEAHEWRGPREPREQDRACLAQHGRAADHGGVRHVRRGLTMGDAMRARRNGHARRADQDCSSVAARGAIARLLLGELVGPQQHLREQGSGPATRPQIRAGRYATDLAKTSQMAGPLAAVGQALMLGFGDEQVDRRSGGRVSELL
jgi:hypothetical protein